MALVMIFTLLPTTAFATKYTDSNPGSSYKVGDTYTGTTKPDAPAKTVWVQEGEPTTKDVLTCTKEEHTHDESCKTLTCGHVHTEECDSLIVGDWTVCKDTSHYHSESCKDWRSHWITSDGMYCNVVGKTYDGFSGHFLDSDDFCYPGTFILASEVIKAYKDGHNFTEDEKAAIRHLIDLIGNNVTAFYHHDITRVPLTCGHHTDKCYSVTCNKEAHEHGTGCYRQDTVYTWTLKADRNGNGKPDDEETYTVTYDVNGADSGFRDQSFNNLSYNADTPKYTNNGANEVTPTKANHTFGGWDPTVAEKVTAPTSGNAIIYTAQWNPITKPVAPNGDTVKKLLANYQVKVDCSKEAHTLATYGLADGCYEIAPVSGSAANGFTVDVTLKAAEYAKHYDKQNKYPVGAHTTTDKDVTITLTYDSSSTSWEFNGPTAVTTFNVNCTQYTVTFVKDNGEDNEATTVFAGQTVTAPAVTKDHYTLDGWYNGDTAFNFTTPINENITLTAKWTADLAEVLTKEYDWVKVELDDNAAAAHAMLEGQPPFVTVTHDAPGIIPTAGSAKEWWGANPTKVLGKDLTGVKLGKGTNSIDLAIKGVVTPTGDDYTVTLSEGKQVYTLPSGQFAKRAITLAINVIKNYPDATDKIIDAIKKLNKIDGINIPEELDAATVLQILEDLASEKGTATFTYLLITVKKADAPTPATYTVRFDANGGDGTMASQTFTEGQEQALTANAFTKKDYVFSGWNTESDGTGTSYKDQATITVSADMTLYAQWKADKNHDGTADENQTFTVDYKDGETVLKTFGNLKVGAKTPAYEGTPKKDGYLFKGWQPAVAATVDAADADAKCFITYTAKWEAIVLNTTVFDLIHVHMDPATTADLNALKGEGAKHVRLESAQYDKVEALLGYRVMAPIGVKSNANWWTENFAKKVTAAEITNVILAADKPVGSSDKIVIPMTGNEKYTVTLGYELIDVTLYGVDIDKICGELDKIQLPDLPQVDIDLEGINNVIQLIQTLKNMGLTYDQIFQLMEIVMDGKITPEEYAEILKILKGLNIKWDDIFEILKKLDKEDLEKLISALKKIDIAALAAKLQDLKEIISKLENIDCDDIEEALEQLKNAATKENIESALKQLKDALQRIDVDDLQSQLNELLAKLEQMDKEALIAKIKELIKNQIPDDELDCMTPDELKELLESLIIKHQYSLSCLCINISKKNAPIEPTDDELKTLLTNKVTVDCISTTAGHEDKTYGWIEGGVTLGPVVETKTTWTCTATLAGWVYADAYNKGIGVDHPVTGVKPEDAAIDLTWNGGKWITGNGVTFQVNCDKTIKEPTEVTEDIVKNLLKGQVVVKCTNGKASHDPKSYGWIDGGVQIGEVTGNTCPITIVTWVYADAYNKDVAPDHPVTIQPETVTFNLTWVSNVWTLNVADIPTIKVACKTGEEVTAKHTVTFDFNYDNMVIRVPVENGKTVTALKAERSGYVFGGWYLGDAKYDFITPVTDSITLVAGWKVDRNNNGIADEDEYCTVTYSDGVGGTVFEKQVYGELLIDDPTPAFKGTPSRSNYSFNGWKPVVTDKITGTVEYVAQWTYTGDNHNPSYNYTLTYVYNYGNKTKSESHAKNAVVKLTLVPSRPGYVFTGWYADKELTEYVTQVKMTGNKKVYAGWRKSSVPDMLNGDDHFAYIQGYADGTVRPDNKITRAQVATIFFRLLDEDVRDDSLTTYNTFTDVSADYWANTAISTMSELGVIQGYSDGTFRPNAFITRAQFAAICARFDDTVKKGSSNFTDIDGHWAEAEIERAATLGWIQGYSDGTFRPNNNITRAQAMTMINRVLCRLPEEEDDLLRGMNTWTDCNPGDWCYLAVQEATNSHDFQYKGDIYETWTDLNRDPDWSKYEN